MNVTTLQPKEPIASIHPADLGRRYREGEPGKVRIIDVRTPVEYREKHVPSSTLMPLDTLSDETLREIGAETTEPVFVLCRSGQRARQCLERMKSAGLDHGVLVEGGILGWERENLPLRYGRKAMSLERQVRVAAGTLVFAGALLAWLVNLAWLIVPAFVGVGFIFAGLTDTCAMGLLLARMPWNKVASCE